MTNLVLCLLSMLALCSCMMMSDSSPAPDLTTTEAPVELLIMEEEEEHKMDESSSGSEEKDQQMEEQDSAKSKRTLEGFLGYGYNDVSGDANGLRFNRQLTGYGKARAYFAQPQHAYRYYSGQLVRGAVPQDEYAARTQALQAEAQQHRPYTTIPLPNTNSVDHGVTPEYFAKAAYQQQFAYQPAPGSAASAPQTAPVYTPAPHAFYALPASHQPQVYPAANPFLALAPGHNFLLPHSGSTAFALLQNPSSPYGPQIIPIIILRVAPGAEHPALQHQHQHQQQPAAFLQNAGGLNLFYHQPQQSSSQNQQQQQHIIYQENPKAHYIQASQKAVYKKPVGPTQAPTTVTQKARKNIIVVNEQTDSPSEAPYSQYKYGSYKEKA